MSKVVHYEIPVDDPERAQRFYSKVFGWEFENWGGEGGYWLTPGGVEEEPGVGGALISRSDLHRAPVVIVGVESVEAALQEAESAGAEVVHPKTSIPGVGYSGYLRDPEGNVVGVFEPDDSASV
ncbi:MAG: VOC family protein [Nitriliruptorales bacterium]|nr:VOC family protein [Nitriliruptorales bacterium]